MTLQKGLSVAGFVVGLALLALGAHSHDAALLGVGASMALPALLASGFGSKVVAAAPELEKGVETAEKFLPLVPFLPPAYQAVAHALLDDADSALKALSAASGNAAPAGPSPVEVAAAAGAKAAQDPAKVM